MATQAQIRDASLSILNDADDSSIYDTSFLNLLINSETHTFAGKYKWSFLERYIMVRGAQNQTLLNLYTPGDATITVDNVDNAPASGALWIEGEILTYTSIVGTAFQGVSGGQITHNPGAAVEILIPMPSGFQRMPGMSVQRGVGADPIPYKFIDKTRYWNNTQARVFTFVMDNNGNEYLRIYGVERNDIIRYTYQTQPTTLVNDADVSSIPDPYALQLIPLFVAAKAMLIRNDNLEGLGTEIKTLADEQEFEMQKLYGQREESLADQVQSTFVSGPTDFSPTFHNRF